MALDIGNILSVIIGGLSVFAGQWFASRQTAKVETQKWKREESREVRRDIVNFRERRALTIIEPKQHKTGTFRASATSKARLNTSKRRLRKRDEL